MQNKHLTENTPAAAYNTRQLPTTPPAPMSGTPAPRPGERAADLIYSDAETDIGGVWVYPACYDDFTLAYRRANSLTRGFGVPFGVTLLTPHPHDKAVSEPGYYAFTRADPRPFVLHILPRPFAIHDDLSGATSNTTSDEEAGR